MRCRSQRLVIFEICVFLAMAILGLCYTAGYLLYLGAVQNGGITVLWSLGYQHQVHIFEVPVINLSAHF